MTLFFEQDADQFLADFSEEITIEIQTASRARNTNVATLVLADVTGLAKDLVVIISGVGGTGYNGTVTLLSVSTGAKTITYASTGSNELTAVDTEGRVLISGNTIDGIFDIPQKVVDMSSGQIVNARAQAIVKTSDAAALLIFGPVLVRSVEYFIMDKIDDGTGFTTLLLSESI